MTSEPQIRQLSWPIFPTIYGTVRYCVNQLAMSTIVSFQAGAFRIQHGMTYIDAIWKNREIMEKSINAGRLQIYLAAR